jgi:DNA invertase Pin-like site-specific DNA recombinase
MVAVPVMWGWLSAGSSLTSLNVTAVRELLATKPPNLAADRQEQLRRLAATGEPVRELAAAFGIGRATAYRYLS